MNKKLTIGYKFCGNCNPHIDTVQLLTELKKELTGEVTFVFWRDSVFDMLLIISGCLSDCAQRPDYAGPVLVVAANTLNFQPVKKESLKVELIQRIREINQSQEW
jgi:hypothetical protein